MNTLNNLIQKLISNTISTNELDELRDLLNDGSNQGAIEDILDTRFRLPRAEEEGLTQLEKENVMENVRGKQSERNS